MFPPRQKKSILLVNPWIHDFAAYDFWMKPLGLLYVGAVLRAAGCEVRLLDCLNLSSALPQYTAGLKSPRQGDFGRGHFYKEDIPKPEALRHIPRQYRRYGIPPRALRETMAVFPRPDLVLMTSSMTYWYSGLAETVRFLRQNIPGVPIYLGGTYATLCADHAANHSGADQVLPGPWDGEKLRLISESVGDLSSSTMENFSAWPYPAFDLYPRLEYVCLLTRQGCPFSCTYCAASQLTRGMESRSPLRVIEEVIFWKDKWGVNDFAFYDDALLINPAGHIVPLLRELIARRIGCRFHTPNALHIKAIDEEVADLLYQGGFRTLRLGLESANEERQMETGGKVENREFQKAVRNLKKAGYTGEEIGVYLMAGIPGQRVEEVEESIAWVQESGAKPLLAEYSPIPGTPMFEQAKKMSPFDLENEPLFHNNSLFPCRWEGFTWEDFRRLKEKINQRKPWNGL
jgi:radical SAM superfamily enzyme YgiQ (UPF0313 family)